MRRILITTAALALTVGVYQGAAMEEGADEHAHHMDHGEAHANGRHLALAPIGVMGDHIHHKGDWMFSYRYMTMRMDGNRDGDSSVSTSDVLKDFMVAPTEMTMEMHMFGAMYAPTDNLTLMAMLPYVLNDMDHVTRMGGRFSTDTEGVGDVKVTALWLIEDWGQQRLHLNLGLSLPTGSIDEKGTTPMGHVQLPYPMQLGSGTYDFMPGITYVGQDNDWSWGSQILGVIHLGENDNDYTLGDKVQLTGWGSYKWTRMFSTSLRMDLQDWGNIDGADPKLSPMVVPTADPDRRGGTRLDIDLGASLEGQQGFWKGQRLAFEVALPLYQDLDGPQLEMDWGLVVGYQKLW